MANKKNKSKKSLDNNKIVIKTLLVFLSYFIYTNVVDKFLSFIGINEATIVSFIADIIFLVGIVIVYKQNLKKAFKDIKKNYTLPKIVKTILLWVGVIFVFNIFMGMLTEIISPNMALDENTDAIFSISEISAIYTIFKTMIFAVVAEELLFRESINEIIKNKYVFIFVTSIIYTIMNFIYLGFASQNIIMYLMPYFLPALIFSYSYVKNNRNIFILMLIKFTYQLIPLTILLLGL